MAHILVQGDALTYPYDPAQLRRDFPQVSFPRVMTLESLAEHGVFPVVAVDRPLPDIATDVEEGPPELVDGVWTERWLVTNAQPAAIAHRLATMRAAAVAEVNQGAGAFRQRFITDIPGQQATYLGKEQEALAWTEQSDPAAFPYLFNEATESGVAMADIVTLVLATAAQWRALDAKIEGKRRGAAVAIAAAATAAEITEAAQVDWEALLA